jgi:hypothetical protein
MRPCTVAIALAAAALQITACDRAPNIAGPAMRAPASPAYDAIVSKTNEQDIPWEQVEENPCNGDMVTIAGTSHFLMNFVFDDTGGYHLYTRRNAKGTGVGVPSLGTYKADETFVYYEQNPEGDQFTISQEDHLLILAPKKEDNYVRHMVFKLTQPAGGVPTASFERSWTKCVG